MKYLVIHCSDTPNEREVTAEDIHRWHSDPKPKGNGWAGIGYHAVIRRNGLIEYGRPEYWSGAHVKNHNTGSLGVCLIGRDQFTDAQFLSLRGLLDDWLHKYPNAKIKGHYELDEGKTCPNFDVPAWCRHGQV